MIAQAESQPETEVSQGDIHERFEAWLNADDKAEEQEEEVVAEAEQTEEESSEELDASQSDEDESEDSEEGDLTTLNVDGEEFKLPAEVAEKVIAAQKRMEADYTRKTQEAAEIRKAAQQFYEQTKQDNELRQKTLELEVEYYSVLQKLKEYEDVDWSALAEQDISAYSRHKEIRDGLKEKASNIAAAVINKRQEIAEKEAQEKQARYQWTVDMVRKAIPQYDEEMDKKAVKAAINLGKKYGITVEPAYLQTLHDPLIWIGLTELAKYQELQEKRPEISKKVASVKNMAKPVQKSHKSSDRSNKIKALLKAGRIREAAEL